MSTKCLELLDKILILSTNIKVKNKNIGEINARITTNSNTFSTASEYSEFKEAHKKVEREESSASTAI